MHTLSYSYRRIGPGDLIIVDLEYGDIAMGPLKRIEAAVKIYGPSWPCHGVAVPEPLGIDLLSRILRDVANGDHVRLLNRVILPL